MASLRGEDNRPKFESMSGFQEIKSVNTEDTFTEKAEKCLMILFETSIELTKGFFLPLTVKFAIIYLIFDLIFYGNNLSYTVMRIVFLIVLLVYEKRSER